MVLLSVQLLAMKTIRWSVVLAVLAVGCGEEATSPDGEVAHLDASGALRSEFAVPVPGRRIDVDRAREIVTEFEGPSSFAIPESEDSAFWGVSPVEGEFDVSGRTAFFDSCGEPGGTPLESIDTVEDLTSTTYTKVAELLGGTGDPPPFVTECDYVGSLGWCVNDQLLDFTMFGIDAQVTIESTTVDLWQSSGDYHSYSNTDFRCTGEECDHPFPAGIVENGPPCSTLYRIDWERIGDL